MKNTKLAFCKFSKYPILKSIRVKFSRYKQKSMNVSVSFDTLISTGKFDGTSLLNKKALRANDAHSREDEDRRERPRSARECAEAHSFLFTRTTSQSPCLRETLAAVAITRGNSRSVFLLVPIRT